MIRFLLLIITAIPLYAEKPNIILIMADDMGYGELSCTGHKTFKTPILDKMATEGLFLIDYHSNGYCCSPTRAALMTGNYQTRTGIEGVVTAKRHRNTGMALKEKTMAEYMKELGYATALFGKWHLGYSSEFNPVKQGFDKYEGFVSGNIDLFTHIDQEGFVDWWVQDELKETAGYMTRLVTDRSIDFIRSNKDKPFFIYLAHAAPHYPYQGPGDKGYRKPGKPKPVGGIVEDKKRAYKDMVEFMDAEIGRILEELKTLKLEENTLLVFCSDNGGVGSVGSSNGIYRGTKGSFFEGGHRVPGIFYWPGKIKPLKSDVPAMSMDMLPTFIELAGGTVEGFDGVSLKDFLLNQKEPAERPLFWRAGKAFAVRSSDYKLINTRRTNKLMLFNLKDDPSEVKDLSQDMPEKLQEMIKIYKDWERKVTEGVTFKSQ